MRGTKVTLLAVTLLAGCGQMPVGGGGGGGGATPAPVVTPSPAATARPVPGGGGGPAAPATPAPANVTGNWTITYQFNPTPPGQDQINYSATGALALTQTGTSVAGTYSEPGFSSPVTGNVAGRTLNLTIGPMTRNGMSETITQTATIPASGNTATGSVTLNASGQSRSLTLTGRSSLTRR